jgi:Asp-tRNA(Asn)/Glu-tRNA(Gln) amidotransferase A subunit family amidase
MPDDGIGFFSATELGAMYRAKTLSPVEVAQAVLRRIARVDPHLNAMTQTTPDIALAQARAAEAAFLRGDAAGPLMGVPVTIKDLHPVAGVKCEYGSFTMQGHVPAESTPSVTRLQEAGTVMVGKTTAPEFGWKGVSQSPLTGITHNPWKHGYNAGASSAGAGAAAAAGYGPLHQGSDGAGSIRMPAHFCGIFGLKPTFGRVPLWPMSNNDTATHIGPMTRTVADAALMLHAMAGPHPWDYLSLEASPPSPPIACSRRIGRSTNGIGYPGRSSPIPSTCPATPRRASRPASRHRACRWVCRSSANASTTSAYCKPRRRSSVRFPGRTSGRQCDCMSPHVVMRGFDPRTSRQWRKIVGSSPRITGRLL